MSQHFLKSLEEVNKSILEVGALVEEAINNAILAFVNRRPEMARDVIAGDDEIDRREIAVEELCLRLLALYQPVAQDLRFIVSVLKVNSELERMGDLAGDIADRSLSLSNQEPLQVNMDMTTMAERVRAMVREALDALVRRDASLAKRVIAEDDEVDRLNYQHRGELINVMHADPSNVERGLLTLLASRHLERIADHAVNVAEDVVYMVEGSVIRHFRG